MSEVSIDAVEIKAVEIKVGKKVLRLTLNELRELRSALDSLLGTVSPMPPIVINPQFEPWHGPYWKTDIWCNTEESATLRLEHSGHSSELA